MTRVTGILSMESGRCGNSEFVGILNSEVNQVN